MFQLSMPYETHLSLPVYLQDDASLKLPIHEEPSFHESTSTSMILMEEVIQMKMEKVLFPS